MRSFFLLLAVLATFSTSGWAIDIGEKVEGITLKDTWYLPRTLEDLGEADAYVLAFITNECPLAQRYLPKLVELHEKYDEQNVRFVAVNVGPADTITEAAWHAQEHGITFPVTKDWSTETAQELGVTRTPEVVILDSDHIMRYRGRVDDQYRLGGVKPTVGRADLEEALKEVLAGEEVSVKTTPADGCAITAPKVPEPETAVTYHKDIEPIMNQHCLPCHRPGGQGPFSLNSYNKVSARADMVAEVMIERRMPPWYAHPDHGEFLNDQSVPEGEIMKIRQWLEGGKVEGEPAEAPEKPVFEDTKWRIEPNVVISAKQPSALPATGFVPYQYIFLPYEFEEDTYVEAIEIRPDNPKVLHHGNLFFTRGQFQVDATSDFLTGTVPGGMPSELRDGIAWEIPAGATLGLQLHYVTTGKPEACTVEVALRFARGTVDKLLYYHNFDSKDIAVPPYEPNYRIRKEMTLEEDVSTIGLFSHMHLRGKSMWFEAQKPGADPELLLTLPNYSFDWQLTYTKEPFTQKWPAGTKVTCEARWDNSTWNPYNPAPGKTIKEGPQTVDEMMNGFFVYTKDDESLGLKVDPKTGFAMTSMASAE
jgi:thiol-disulfide isomerase/thioredoxin